MEISFIIPIHNSHKTITKVIESLEKNLLSGDEVLFIDNNSKDNSQRLIASAITFHNYRIEGCQEQGASFARNMGAVLATKKMLVFLDSDVILDLRWRERFEQMRIKIPVQVYGFKLRADGDQGFFTTYRRTLSEYNSQTETGLPYVHKKNMTPLINSSFFAIENQIFKNLGMFNISLKRCEDTDFSIKVFNQKILTCFMSDCGSVLPGEHSLMSYLKRSYDIGYWTVVCHQQTSRTPFDVRHYAKEHFENKAYHRSFLAKGYQFLNILARIAGAARSVNLNKFPKSHHQLFRFRHQLYEKKISLNNQLYYFDKSLWISFIDDKALIYDICKNIVTLSLLEAQEILRIVQNPETIIKLEEADVKGCLEKKLLIRLL